MNIKHFLLLVIFNSYSMEGLNYSPHITVPLAIKIQQLRQNLLINMLDDTQTQLDNVNRWLSRYPSSHPASHTLVAYKNKLKERIVSLKQHYNHTL